MTVIHEKMPFLPVSRIRTNNHQEASTSTNVTQYQHNPPVDNGVIHGIIHAASVSSAMVGAGLAQIPGSDAPVLAGIQTTMIITLARQYGVALNDATAADLVLTFAATVGGRTLSQLLVGWIPVWGNTINASTAMALTEAVGWAADSYFSRTRAA